jgi:hypothetical protein
MPNIETPPFFFSQPATPAKLAGTAPIHLFQSNLTAEENSRFPLDWRQGGAALVAELARAPDSEQQRQ